MLTFEAYQDDLYRIASYYVRRFCWFNFEIDELVAECWIRLHLRNEPKVSVDIFRDCEHQIKKYIVQQTKAQSRRRAAKAGRAFPQLHLLNEIDEEVFDASPDDFWDYVAEELSRTEILILKLYFIEGYCFSEMTKILGLDSTGTTYYHYQKACLKLKDRLGLYLESLK